MYFTTCLCTTFVDLGRNDTCFVTDVAKANNIFDKTHGAALRDLDLFEEDELPAEEDLLERLDPGEVAFFFFFERFPALTGAAGIVCVYWHVSPALHVPDAKYLQGMAERGEPLPERERDPPPFLRLPLPRPFVGLRPRLLPRGLLPLGCAYLQSFLLQRPVFCQS